MTVQTITYPAYAAYLEPLTGQGLLVLPASPWDGGGDEEVWAGFCSADHVATMAYLEARGWVLSEPDDGDIWCSAGYMPDGREVVGLFSEESSIDDPTLDQMIEGDHALRAALGFPLS